MHSKAISLKHDIARWMMLVFVLLAMMCFAQQVRADIYCDPTIEQAMEQRRQNAIMKKIAQFDSAYRQPNSFDSMYCGAQINLAFDQIGNTLINGINSQINSMIQNLFQQACRAALAPIQNLAAQACIPNFAMNFGNNNNCLADIFGGGAGGGGGGGGGSNSASNNYNRARNCLTQLVDDSRSRNIQKGEILLCLPNNLNQTRIIDCLVDLFNEGRRRTLSANELTRCIGTAPSGGGGGGGGRGGAGGGACAPVNYCQGTQLIQVTPIINGPSFNGGVIPSYPALFW